MTHLWHQYWAWVGGNIGAMPLETLIAVVAGGISGLLLRPLYRRLWAWLKAELAGTAHEDAAAARRIAADLHKRLTGEVHPDAPGQIRTSADASDHGSEAR